ncbi:ISL3 family transposase (plasmid) [Arsenicicoccus dermatophilus]|nr:ISL3 family transposase [Arsenicicoccus dermatophilus]MCH8614414.1 ISL3 family transposase [Arsenicicoccus dermatophilus]
MRVLDVACDEDPDRLVVRVESVPDVTGCPVCGVVAHAHDRDDVRLVDVPSFGRPVRLVWVKRRYVCPEPACAGGTFSEQDEAVAAPRALLTTRAVAWAVEQVRREHASIAGLARQLGVQWNTVWHAVRARLEQLDADPARFDGVTMLGVDEHVWHHVDQRKRGPKMLTGMVDLTRDEHGRVRARLLDLVPGRSGTVYGDWLTQRGDAFRAGVEVATLDPFHGYKNATSEHLADATAVVDAFHVVKLATSCVDDVRRRVQQATLGHRGRKGDPLYRVRTILRAGVENLTDKQKTRLTSAFAANDAHVEVQIAWQVAQDVRALFHADAPATGRAAAQRLLGVLPTCPIPEVRRLGKTLKQWAEPLLAYFDTGGASNGGTEAVNGLIELHRRIARGFRNRDNYRLRCLLIAGGLTP